MKKNLEMTLPKAWLLPLLLKVVNDEVAKLLLLPKLKNHLARVPVRVPVRVLARVLARVKCLVAKDAPENPHPK
jgi:hypothetical protein